jgi:type I restriction enzyme S subunit
MGSEWSRKVISEVCDLIVDCVNKTAPIVEGPTPYKMIRTPNIKNGRVSLEGCRFVEEETFKKWTRRSSVQRGDVLLTREAPLGEVGIVQTDESIFLGQRVMQYRSNPKKMEPQFLLYSFLSPDLQHQFQLHEGSGSVVSHIRVGDCSKFEINLPPLNEQKVIAHILGSLDAKIELNRRMNTTLEGMAQALFKSWFVDFDPVLDNALAAGNPIPDELAERAVVRRQALADGTANREAAKQFPATFQLSEEMGWIPEGWETSTFGSVASNIRDSVNPQNLATGTPYVGLEHVGRKQIYLSDWGFVEDVDSNKSAFQKGDVLFGKLRPYFHKVCIMNFDGVCSTDILVFRAKEDRWGGFVQYQLFDETFVEHANARSTGTRMPRASWQDMVAYPIAKPSIDVVALFAELVTDFNAKAMLNVKSVGKLGAIRDALLPMLISGELRIPDAEKLIEEVV